MINVTVLPLGQMQTNCYILTDEKSGESAVCDPGIYLPVLEDEIKDLNVKYILLTHGHFDHVWGVKELKEKTNAKVVISREDEKCLGENEYNLCRDVGIKMNVTEADIVVSDGDELSLGDEKIRVISTPGHTDGSVCYICEDSRIMLSGDTLFCLTCGRTDMLGGDSEKMRQSLLKLKNLDGDYRVLPGHNRETTLNGERVRNRYMKRDLEKWYW